MKTARHAAVWNVAVCGQPADVPTEDHQGGTGESAAQGEGSKSHLVQSHTSSETAEKVRLPEYWTDGYNE